MTPGLYVILLESILFTLLIRSGACDDNFTACGDDRPEVLQVPGPLQYPSYPNGTYMPGLFCSWMLDAGEGRASTLDFSYFDLETVFPCVYANLTIYDAETEDKSMMIGQYCGTDTIPTIMSSHRYLLVVFKTDSGAGAEGMGFSAHFDIEEVEEPACYNPGSKDISYPIGGFSSPQWPGSYPKGSSCEWILTAHQEYRLEYRDWGGVGSKTSMMECQNDYVKVTDVGTTETKELGVYCGPVPPDPHGLLGDALKFEFSSNTGTTSSGFRTTYTAVNNTDWACGGSNPAILDWSPGYITSSSNAGSICRWRLRARRGKLIYLQLKSFLIPPTTNCAQASLKIYDGEFATARLIGVYCGDKQPEYIAFSSEFAFLEFQSNIPDAMFQMTYEFYDATAKACVGSVENKPMELNNSRGIITSPYLGQTSYPSNANCQWRIKGKLGEVIRYSFNYIDIEYCPSCNCDYIYIYNSDQPESGDIISKYCGSERAPSVLTSQPNAYITFHSDATETRGGGFELDYSVVTLSDLACYGNETAKLQYQPGDILSPYDDAIQSYPPGVSCQWQLDADDTVKTFNRIEMEFNRLDLSDDCTTDYIHIHVAYVEGNDTRIESMEICGNKKPGKMSWLSTQVLVEFHSGANSGGGDGFHITYIFKGETTSSGNIRIIPVLLFLMLIISLLFMLASTCELPKYAAKLKKFICSHVPDCPNCPNCPDFRCSCLECLHPTNHNTELTVDGEEIMEAPRENVVQVEEDGEEGHTEGGEEGGAAGGAEGGAAGGAEGGEGEGAVGGGGTTQETASDTAAARRQRRRTRDVRHNLPSTALIARPPSTVDNQHYFAIANYPPPVYDEIVFTRSESSSSNGIQRDRVVISPRGGDEASVSFIVGRGTSVVEAVENPSYEVVNEETGREGRNRNRRPGNNPDERNPDEENVYEDIEHSGEDAAHSEDSNQDVPGTSTPNPPNPSTSEPEPSTSAAEPSTSTPEPRTFAPGPSTSAPEPSTSAESPVPLSPGRIMLSYASGNQEDNTDSPSPTLPDVDSDSSYSGSNKNKGNKERQDKTTDQSSLESESEEIELDTHF